MLWVVQTYDTNMPQGEQQMATTTTTAFTQAEKVAEYLKAGRTLTAREALARWDVRNLRARIFELRQGGMNIGTIPYTRKDGVNAVKYVMQATPARKRTRA
jgi:hypothetical protein